MSRARRIALERTAEHELWAPLVREVVEGIVCERCERCRREGAVP